ncbi:SulP family inorganic anion transporter [Solicola gregarius]|uniref:SulP family inorganic anion transporter n=1 Tax=Solicola gregarius TaxID=2908642 RepID=A0AA46TF17_9ACTN|nr:SulP family inorganic anion transporter [Solicola gregarius]UYM03617.1 SulP family inorganic anion transporter [Solicola gregarius]
MTGSFPVFRSFAGYQRAWLRNDVIAGLTVWAVLVPESLAYATIAGVSPVVGLYAAVPALVLYAAFGSSRHLVVGPMSGTAALSASVVAAVASGGSKEFVAATTALAVIVGALGVVAGLCRLGFLSEFISEPVLKGFIVGLALTIIIGQIPAILGIEKEGEDFFEKAWQIIIRLDDVDLLTFGIGAVALAGILVARRFIPLVPGSLVFVLLGILAVAMFDLDDEGVEIVGTIDAGLPSLGLPDLAASTYLDLIGPCVGVLLIGYAEGLGAAKTYAAKEGYDIDPNRELIGMGASNLGTGVLSGMVVNGSLSKTAVNGSAGAKSQASGLVVAVLTVVTLLFLTGLFEKLPEAVLAAVVIAAVIELVDFASIRRLYGVWTSRLGKIYRHSARADFASAIGAMFGVLIFDTLPGLFIGIGLSALALLYRSSRPAVTRLARQPGADGAWVDAGRKRVTPPDPEIEVLRVESGLYFANADYVREHVRAAVTDQTRAVILDGETTPFLDVTAASMLVLLAGDMQRSGIALVFAHDVGQVRDVFSKTEAAGIAEVHPTVDDAVAAIRSRLDETATGADPAAEDPPDASGR